MNKKEIIDLLTSEIRYSHNPVKEIRDAIVWWWVLVFAILFLMRPFGLSDSNRLYLIYECFGYSVATFLPFLINILLVKNRLLKLVENKWYIHHELLFYLLVFPQVCFLNFIFSSQIVGDFPFSILSFFKLSAYTALLFVPIAIFKTILTITARYNKEVVVLNTKIEYFKEMTNFNELPFESKNSIELIFENEALTIQRSRIALITAWGNYIKTMVNTDTKSVEVVKRGRIKNVEEQLIKYPEFIRCHRSYILNLKYIRSIIGNAKASDAVLMINEMKVPIARGNIKKIREYFEKERLNCQGLTNS